jgi:hypothetical protein
MTLLCMPDSSRTGVPAEAILSANSDFFNKA